MSLDSGDGAVVLLGLRGDSWEEISGNISVRGRMTLICLRVDDRQGTLGTFGQRVCFGSRGLADLDSDVLAQGEIK